MLKTILSVIFVLICLALTVIVLLQEGKSQGLGAIGGMAETYWGKNKGCLLYTSPSPRDGLLSRMPSSA